MDSLWYYRNGALEVGPISFEDLRGLFHSGRLAATDFVRSDGRTWQPAGACLDALTPEPSSKPPQLPPPLPVVFGSMGKTVWPLVAGAAAVCLLFGLLVLLLAVTAGDESGQTSENVSGNAAGDPDGALSISGTDATEELAEVLAGMSDRQLTSIGIAQLTPGQDLYGIRVRISNDSGAPIYVRPENIRLHLGNDSVGVIVVQDSRFLQPALLQPGRYLDGLVAYRAYTQAGAAMRLGRGAISYDGDLTH